MNSARLTEIDIRDGVAPPTTTVVAAPAGTTLEGAGSALDPLAPGEDDPGAVLEAGAGDTEAGKAGAGTEERGAAGGLECCAVEACPVVHAAARSNTTAAATGTPATRRPAICVLAALRWQDIRPSMRQPDESGRILFAAVGIRAEV
ncbi:MAG TPA: hypothetical protein VK662_02730 [Acidothermaceae bacterium]|nr:hypothetical protein [Acidothermaceae bacterium]